MNSWKVWLHGLAAAFIGAGATAAAGALGLPSVFNFSHEGLINFAKVCIIPAAFNAASYLSQSPVPALTSTVTLTQTMTKTPEDTK